MDKFERDLESLMDKLKPSLDELTLKRLIELKERLVKLHREQLVKINHSVMELLCAADLLAKGYSVTLEHPLDGSLTCDIYGYKGEGSFIIEVETGFVPPEHALDPLSYRKARIASKIVRYGNYATKFGLASPPYHIMQIPEVLVKPPKYRSETEVWEIKSLCDRYYRNPPVTIDEIMNTRLHVIYLVNVDEAQITEVDPITYIERYLHVNL
ncbi:hypothetical protein DRO28_03080 [Candidatus Bathyarchaeota archaeon]|nr:MAG: hypothetical protein DRO28_03080 [Candidatus Bathyarchaeota archaeon]